MQKQSKITSVLIMSAILFTSAIAASIPLMQDVDASMKASGTYTKKIGSKSVCGDRMCSEWEGGRAGYEAAKKTATIAIGEKIAELEKAGTTGEKSVTSEGNLQSQLEKILKKLHSGMTLSTGEITLAKKAIQESISVEIGDKYYADTPEVATGTPSLAQGGFGLTASGTMTSVQDPGQGHESHQIAIILPPTDKVYVGKVTYSASEPVQYVTIHGPLAEGESRGQPIWSPMGDTTYALTFIDNGGQSGGWFFAGNALALHTMHDTPFTATYSVAYAEVEPGVYPKGTVETGTITSVQDPGMGHESHSLALILPLRDIPYQGGVVAYSASTNIQLVALMGPLDDDEILGQTIWAHGDTKYALTLIDGGKMGVWNTFSGNALALHSFNPEGFTATYTLAGLH